MSSRKFVNWQRYFDANQGAAQAGADKLAQQQRSAAESAQRATSGLLNQFTQKAGVTAAQTGAAAKAAAVGGATNVGLSAAQPTNGLMAAAVGANAQPQPTAQPGAVAKAMANAPVVGVPTAQPRMGLTATPGVAASSAAAPGAAAKAAMGDMANANVSAAKEQAGLRLAGPPKATPLTPEQALADAEAKAKLDYTGPESLGDLEGSGAALDQNLAAQKGLNLLGSESGIEALNQQLNPNLTSGESRFGSALTATAGRNKFDKLRSGFSLQKDWESAEARAKALAGQGTEKAKAEAAKWAARAADLKGDEAGKARDAKTIAAAEKAQQEAMSKSIAAGATPKPTLSQKSDRPGWGQFNLEGEFTGNDGVAGATRAALPSVFSIFGGDEHRWKAMSDEEYQQFTDLWAKAKGTGANSPERQAVKKSVDALKKRYP